MSENWPRGFNTRFGKNRNKFELNLRTDFSSSVLDFCTSEDEFRFWEGAHGNVYLIHVCFHHEEVSTISPSLDVLKEKFLRALKDNS